MVRVKRGLMTHKRHKNLLAQTKGFRMRNNNIFTLAKNALAKAGTNAYIGRKLKKRDFRRLWTIRIGNGLRDLGLKYSIFINLLYKKQVKLDRKALAHLSVVYPDVFAQVVKFVK